MRGLKIFPSTKAQSDAEEKDEEDEGGGEGEN
jgi:hypothetical protein